MINITLIRKITGRELIRSFEDTYISIENLEKLFKEDNENMNLQMDLDDWKYFIDHKDEEVEDGRTIFLENNDIDKIGLGLLDLIKNEKPNSISQLAKLANNEVNTTLKKAKLLEKEGLISFKSGSKNRKIPIMNYDNIHISI
ncbi:HVO_A0114 family putative DNA-binding protein [Methanobrevibacter filiformis]|uniref:Uncharacterized protein n=1 Tax=Methanobrevibacter filiformis TaxID=55758 RepID=A0A166ELC9_9EURY|nr:hypothetical protein [Methanobrevibacter filiformis]KZX16783.1 hypothetical protein MBFIL_04740 [Methanobrevibacter filiformis]